jgi:hypothetical protein
MVMDDFGVTSLGVTQSFCDATPARKVFLGRRGDGPQQIPAQ